MNLTYVCFPNLAKKKMLKICQLAAITFSTLLAGCSTVHHRPIAQRVSLAKPIVDGPEIPGLNRRPIASPESHFLVRSAHTNVDFAKKGDSGAIVFSGDGRILGMIRAVSDNAGTNPSGFRAVVTKMTKIRDEFNLRVLS